MTEGIVWSCRCGHRTLRHIEWCASCGNPLPPPPPEPEPSHKPSIIEDETTP